MVRSKNLLQLAPPIASALWRMPSAVIHRTVAQRKQKSGCMLGHWQIRLTREQQLTKLLAGCGCIVSDWLKHRNQVQLTDKQANICMIPGYTRSGQQCWSMTKGPESHLWQQVITTHAEDCPSKIWKCHRQLLELELYCAFILWCMWNPVSMQTDPTPRSNWLTMRTVFWAASNYCASWGRDVLMCFGTWCTETINID